jgi:hypothetical protein
MAFGSFALSPYVIAMTTPLTIQFLNHASVRIISDTTTIVSDPWYSGSIFNNGWELLWTSERLAGLAADADFFWISHEHPDHFSPAFFRSISSYKGEVVFQRTRDQRLARYLRDHGFVVHEVNNGGSFPVSKTEHLTIGTNGLYDSWSLYGSATAKILNLNDCIVKTPADLRVLKKRVGHIDVLLTQFSYAGWVGDRHNKSLRELAARRRLEVVRAQLEHLQPTYVIPFASFVWFCHDENAYLNDSVNRISAFLSTCATTSAIPVVLAPMECWIVGNRHDNTAAIDFWERTYDRIPTFERRHVRTGWTISQLKSECARYQARVFAANSKAWLRLLSVLPFLHLFKPVYIRLTDIGKNVRFTFFDELRESDGPRTDIEMSSESLGFILGYDFGFDTLMVNARFSATKQGLDAVMRNFAIGNLNAMGWSVSVRLLWLLLREIKLVWLVFRELKNVSPE